jgi:hypothetical protein
MVSIEELSLVVAIVSGTVIPIIFFILIRHLKDSDSTSDKATMATFNIHSMNKDMVDIKDSIDQQRKHFDKRIDLLNSSIEQRDERWRNDLNKIWDKLDSIIGDVRVHESRLNRVDPGGR